MHFYKKLYKYFGGDKMSNTDNRSEELRKIFKDFDETKFTVVEPLIDEAVYLEEQMLLLKKYPFIKSREYKGEIQTKVTAAGKQYREYLQTYTNIIDKLCRMLGKVEGDEDSPLRDFYKKMMKAGNE
jgi:hypothetical protein